MAAAAGGLPLEPSSLDAVAAPPATAESAAERRRRRDRDGQRRHRRRVAALYAELGAMIPALPTARRRRVTREEVVVAATARVKALEDAAAALEGYRVRPRPGHEVTVSSRGTVNVSARLPAPAPAGALRRVVEAFERRGVRVLVATMARHGAGAVIVTVTAAAAAPEVVEMIRADIATIN
ncbi:hypothetical protein SEVIR_3G361100v4 [Setaria viridis]|uniref:BHLH domain-containing protein n=1 Tax=Setaria viridis TaxID=4556 RepID=A0A4U6VH65_SETVI|nr:uncharacterized protein LOC117850966 [Setaria viridis]TKW28921.1 hypothetical protein SEVIR_3G361100v2 [Setaria viridis]